MIFKDGTFVERDLFTASDRRLAEKDGAKIVGVLPTKPKEAGLSEDDIWCKAFKSSTLSGLGKKQQRARGQRKQEVKHSRHEEAEVKNRAREERRRGKRKQAWYCMQHGIPLNARKAGRIPLDKIPEGGIK